MDWAVGILATSPTAAEGDRQQQDKVPQRSADSAVLPTAIASVGQQVDLSLPSSTQNMLTMAGSAMPHATFLQHMQYPLSMVPGQLGAGAMQHANLTAILATNAQAPSAPSPLQQVAASLPMHPDMFGMMVYQVGMAVLAAGGGATQNFASPASGVSASRREQRSSGSRSHGRDRRRSRSRSASSSSSDDDRDRRRSGSKHHRHSHSKHRSSDERRGRGSSSSHHRDRDSVERSRRSADRGGAVAGLRGSSSKFNDALAAHFASASMPAIGGGNIKNSYESKVDELIERYKAHDGDRPPAQPEDDSDSSAMAEEEDRRAVAGMSPSERLNYKGAVAARAASKSRNSVARMIQPPPPRTPKSGGGAGSGGAGSAASRSVGRSASAMRSPSIPAGRGYGSSAGAAASTLQAAAASPAAISAAGASAGAASADTTPAAAARVPSALKIVPTPQSGEGSRSQPFVLTAKKRAPGGESSSPLRGAGAGGGTPASSFGAGLIPSTPLAAAESTGASATMQTTGLHPLLQGQQDARADGGGSGAALQLTRSQAALQHPPTAAAAMGPPTFVANSSSPASQQPVQQLPQMLMPAVQAWQGLPFTQQYPFGAYMMQAAAMQQQQQQQQLAHLQGAASAPQPHIAAAAADAPTSPATGAPASAAINDGDGGATRQHGDSRGSDAEPEPAAAPATSDAETGATTANLASEAGSSSASSSTAVSATAAPIATSTGGTVPSQAHASLIPSPMAQMMLPQHLYQQMMIPGGGVAGASMMPHMMMMQPPGMLPFNPGFLHQFMPQQPGQAQTLIGAAGAEAGRASEPRGPSRPRESSRSHRSSHSRSRSRAAPSSGSDSESSSSSGSRSGSSSSYSSSSSSSRASSRSLSDGETGTESSDEDDDGSDSADDDGYETDLPDDLFEAVASGKESESDVKAKIKEVMKRHKEKKRLRKQKRRDRDAGDTGDGGHENDGGANQLGRSHSASVGDGARSSSLAALRLPLKSALKVAAANAAAAASSSSVGQQLNRAIRRSNSSVGIGGSLAVGVGNAVGGAAASHDHVDGDNDGHDNMDTGDGSTSDRLEPSRSRSLVRFAVPDARSARRPDKYAAATAAAAGTDLLDASRRSRSVGGLGSLGQLSRRDATGNGSASAAGRSASPDAGKRKDTSSASASASSLSAPRLPRSLSVPADRKATEHRGGTASAPSSASRSGADVGSGASAGSSGGGSGGLVGLLSLTSAKALKAVDIAARAAASGSGGVDGGVAQVAAVGKFPSVRRSSSSSSSSAAALAPSAASGGSSAASSRQPTPSRQSAASTHDVPAQPSPEPSASASSMGRAAQVAQAAVQRGQATMSRLFSSFLEFKPAAAAHNASRKAGDEIDRLPSPAAPKRQKLSADQFVPSLPSSPAGAGHANGGAASSPSHPFNRSQSMAPRSSRSVAAPQRGTSSGAGAGASSSSASGAVTRDDSGIGVSAAPSLSSSSSGAFGAAPPFKPTTSSPGFIRAPKSSLLGLAASSSGASHGLQASTSRSGRTVMPPLKHWAGERLSTTATGDTFISLAGSGAGLAGFQGGAAAATIIDLTHLPDTPENALAVASSKQKAAKKAGVAGTIKPMKRDPGAGVGSHAPASSLSSSSAAAVATTQSKASTSVSGRKRLSNASTGDADAAADEGDGKPASSALRLTVVAGSARAAQPTGKTTARRGSKAAAEAETAAGSSGGQEKEAAPSTSSIAGTRPRRGSGGASGVPAPASLPSSAAAAPTSKPAHKQSDKRASASAPSAAAAAVPVAAGKSKGKGGGKASNGAAPPPPPPPAAPPSAPTQEPKPTRKRGAATPASPPSPAAAASSKPAPSTAAAAAPVPPKRRKPNIAEALAISVGSGTSDSTAVVPALDGANRTPPRGASKKAKGTNASKAGAAASSASSSSSAMLPAASPPFSPIDASSPPQKPGVGAASAPAAATRAKKADAKASKGKKVASLASEGSTPVPAAMASASAAAPMASPELLLGSDAEASTVKSKQQQRKRQKKTGAADGGGDALASIPEESPAAASSSSSAAAAASSPQPPPAPYFPPSNQAPHAWDQPQVDALLMAYRAVPLGGGLNRQFWEQVAGMVPGKDGDACRTKVWGMGIKEDKKKQPNAAAAAGAASSAAGTGAGVVSASARKGRKGKKSNSNHADGDDAGGDDRMSVGTDATDGTGSTAGSTSGKAGRQGKAASADTDIVAMLTAAGASSSATTGAAAAAILGPKGSRKRQDTEKQFMQAVAQRKIVLGDGMGQDAHSGDIFASKSQPAKRNAKSIATKQASTAASAAAPAPDALDTASIPSASQVSVANAPGSASSGSKRQRAAGATPAAPPSSGGRVTRAKSRLPVPGEHDDTAPSAAAALSSAAQLRAVTGHQPSAGEHGTADAAASRVETGGTGLAQGDDAEHADGTANDLDVRHAGGVAAADLQQHAGSADEAEVADRTNVASQQHSQVDETIMDSMTSGGVSAFLSPDATPAGAHRQRLHDAEGAASVNNKHHAAFLGLDHSLSVFSTPGSEAGSGAGGYRPLSAIVGAVDGARVGDAHADELRRKAASGGGFHVDVGVLGGWPGSGVDLGNGLNRRAGVGGDIFQFAGRKGKAGEIKIKRHVGSKLKDVAIVASQHDAGDGGGGASGLSSSSAVASSLRNGASFARVGSRLVAGVQYALEAQVSPGGTARIKAKRADRDDDDAEEQFDDGNDDNDDNGVDLDDSNAGNDDSGAVLFNPGAGTASSSSSSSSSAASLPVVATSAGVVQHLQLAAAPSSSSPAAVSGVPRAPALILSVANVPVVRPRLTSMDELDKAGAELEASVR